MIDASATGAPTHVVETGDTAYYFAHIPKTAGTSFIAVLDRVCAVEKICPAQLWREMATLNPQQLQQYRLFRGHLGGYGLDSLIKRPIKRMTMLRQPVARAVSTYHFIRREPGSRVHQYVMDNELSLGDFANDAVTAEKIENAHVRQLAFSLTDNADRDLWVSDASVAAIDRWMDHYREPLNGEARLNRAKGFLRDCFFFGLCERFADSMDLFAFRFGLPPIGQAQPHRVSRPTMNLDALTRQRLEQLTELDHDLYHYGSQLFEQRLAEMDDSLGPWRRRSDQGRTMALQRRFAAGNPGNVWSVPGRYRFAAPLHGRGWQQRERKLPEGDWFRWTGPEAKASLWFNAITANNTWVLKFRTVDQVAPGSLDHLRVTVNGHPIEVIANHDKDAVRVYRGEVAPGVVHKGLNRLTFKVEQAAPRPDDDRLVGIAIHWVEMGLATN